MHSKIYDLVVTTQGPTYPPSEIMDKDGNFVVIGKLNLIDVNGNFYQEWGNAIVSPKSALPRFGENLPYDIIKRFDVNNIRSEDDRMLYTLPLPLPCNNYPMNFAPEQTPIYCDRPSYPLHQAPIPDLMPEHGRKVSFPIMLSNWVKAKGQLELSIRDDKKCANFDFEFTNLIPESLYTIMALRERDLSPINPTRPGPLGVPNVFITDSEGTGKYNAIMPNPFPSPSDTSNRIISVVLLWMSTQMSYGGAIGHYGLGGDIHAQLKLPGRFFDEFETHE